MTAQIMHRRRRSSSAGTSYTTLSETSPPPTQARAQNPRLHLVMQQPQGKGRRGGPGSRARPSPAPKPPRDPNAPKRPTNPFLRFCEQERDNVRAAHGDEENFDLTKAMGVAWHELDDEQKLPYKHAFNEDQKKYKEDLAAYESLKKRGMAGLGVRPMHPMARDDGSNFDEEVESDDGGRLTNLTGRESPDRFTDRGDGGSVAEVGTPNTDTAGPSGGSGFTAVNRRTQGLDANVFKHED
jgi:HMG (high mobility group) box